LCSLENQVFWDVKDILKDNTAFKTQHSTYCNVFYI